MTGDGNRVTQGASGLGGGEMSEEEIDSILMDSFPASDPPSWTLGTDRPKDPLRESDVKGTLAGGPLQGA